MAFYDENMDLRLEALKIVRDLSPPGISPEMLVRQAEVMFRWLKDGEEKRS